VPGCPTPTCVGTIRRRRTTLSRDFEARNLSRCASCRYL
jgi:hypothetical protein